MGEKNGKMLSVSIIGVRTIWNDLKSESLFLQLVRIEVRVGRVSPTCMVTGVITDHLVR